MKDFVINDVLIDIILKEVNNVKKLVVTLIISIFVLALSFGLNIYFVFERMGYEKVVTETYEYEIEGTDNNVVNGNQYNDTSVHNEKE